MPFIRRKNTHLRGKLTVEREERQQTKMTILCDVKPFAEPSVAFILPFPPPQYKCNCWGHTMVTERSRFQRAGYRFWLDCR